MKKNELKTRLWGFLYPYRKLSVLLALMAIPCCLSAREYSFRSLHPFIGGEQQTQKQVQEHLIKGKVTDARGVPLPGVNVRLDGTITGTATNADGGFSLRLSEQKGVLSFSCIGFKTVKVPFTAGIPLAVRMVEDVAELDEVTIVAYGKQNRREVSGAVTVVKSEQMQGITNSNLSVGLQGLVPGMNVMRETGSPDGKDVSIIIRGCNDLSIGGKRNPLFVIDGVPAEDLAEGNVLTDYNSADIESVTVLKDAASAAIYGSRAANGVILITKIGRAHV